VYVLIYLLRPELLGSNSVGSFQGRQIFSLRFCSNFTKLSYNCKAQLTVIFGANVRDVFHSFLYYSPSCFFVAYRQPK
jgi:hypothetical protein